MSVTEDSPAVAATRISPLPCEASAESLYRLPVYIACTVLALVITYRLGKDVAWDTLDYHIYAGFSALNDRFAQDYFPAGPQSYINPYAYAPFYALLQSGLSGLAIGALLTLWHSVILWLTFELAVSVFPAAAARARATLGVCAVALALTNPILLQQIGSCFADVTTAELALAGWLLLASVVRTPRVLPLVCAAALLGAASALKLTNAVHALGAAAVLILLPLPLWARIRYGVTYAAALGVSFALVTAPWSDRLAQNFGNPFFPLFNNIFRSPQFITQPLRLVRFIPSNLAEALWRPFALVDPAPLIQEELPAPDLRYALLAVLAAALLAKWLWSRRAAPGRIIPAARAAADTRVLLALGCGFTVDWTAWLATSGNGRYFLPMACVCAVLVLGLLTQLSRDRARIWLTAVIAVCAVQIFQMWMSPGVRWTAMPWDNGPWLKVDVPQRLAVEPALYLSVGTNSNAYLAAFVSGQSGFVNFTGVYPLGASGANGARVEALIHRYSGHLRFVAEGERLHEDLKHLPNVADVDGALSRFGLRADPSDCDTITVVGSKPTATLPAAVAHLVTCRVVVGSATEFAPQPAAQQAADTVLDRLEDACPQLLQPPRPMTEFRNRRYQRIYLNTDLFAWVSRGWVKIYNPITGDGPMFVGSERQWLAGPQPMSCGRRNGHDFATVSSAGTR